MYHGPEPSRGKRARRRACEGTRSGSGRIPAPFKAIVRPLKDGTITGPRASANLAVQPLGLSLYDEGPIRDYLEYLDTPRALTVWLLFSAGEHRQLVELGISFEHYIGREPEFARAYAATKLLSKCSGLRTGIDTKAVALETARKAEQTCSATNQFFKLARRGLVRDLRGRDAELIARAQSRIAAILGDCPGIEGFTPRLLDEPGFRLRPLTAGGPFLRAPVREWISTFPESGWTPGRTTSASGNDLSSYKKYRATPHITARAQSLGMRYLRHAPIWAAIHTAAPSARPDLPIVPGNVLIAVPKNAKTDRIICYEPHVNIRLQRNVGIYLRDRLLLAGIDLRDQSVNQRRARQGSIDGRFATLDLRSASDTLATEVVFELLPIDWACLLDTLRCAYTTMPDGTTQKMEKFSAMGNGFTFELETLIFYAVCSAVTSGVSVYGDDIVLPAASAAEAIYALNMFGFEINTSKSFVSGPFRESCGGDYVGGVPITPVYMRRLPQNTLDLVLFHNQVLQWGLQSSPDEDFLDRALYKVLKKWRTKWPFYRGPRGYGDGHYHVSLPDAGPTHVSASGWDGLWFKTTMEKRPSLFKVPCVEFGDSMAGAALCAALGPKADPRLAGSHVDRKKKKSVHLWVLATTWPGYWVLPS